MEDSPGGGGGGGGRLWRMAGKVAQDLARERLQSRAEPDSVVVAPTTPLRSMIMEHESLVVTTTQAQQDGIIHHHHHHNSNKSQILQIDHAVLAQKRVRVVQLMVVGVVGILFGGLGNFFVSDSCYFLSIPAAAAASTTTTSPSSTTNDNDNSEQNKNDIFILHFGIWKYSPVESSATGYPYCIQYHEPYPEPFASRLANSLALLCAVLSMIILWWYLIVGVPISWFTGVASAVAAGCFQILTPILFVQSRLCRAFENKCQTGPSVILSFFVGVLWLIVAAELHYNAPGLYEYEGEQQRSRSQRPTIVPTSLELVDFQDASRQFYRRFYRPPPSTMTASDRCRFK